MATLQEIIDESGYPLQLFLENEVEINKQSSRWRVLVSEHRWINPYNDEEGYIDFVLDSSRYKYKLVVECKRIMGNWIFLNTTLPIEPSQQIKLLHARKLHPTRWWEDLRPETEIFESSYGVLETGGKKDSRTLEKLAGNLLLSTEIFAGEEVSLLQESHITDELYYLPLIVTTAKLHICRFIPTDVNILTGMIERSEIKEYQYIHFRKNLATNIKFQQTEKSTIRDINQENMRSVIIVQAKSFINFITHFKLR
jgi:hypothetical protein